MRAVSVDDEMTVTIKKVGVLGAGQMGSGIAHVAALAGFDVVLNDLSADRLKSAMATINGNLSRQGSKKIITEDARQEALGKIPPRATLAPTTPPSKPPRNSSASSASRSPSRRISRPSSSTASCCR